MFSIAMNDPMMAARTALLGAVLARLGSSVARSDPACEIGSAESEAEGMGFDMARPSGERIRYFGCGCRLAGASLRLGLDGRNHRHARTQFDWRVVVTLKRDLDRYALHHLGEVAGGVVRRQQREFLAAGGRDAVDMAVHHLAGEHVDGDVDC